MNQLKTLISFLLFFYGIALQGQVILLKDGSAISGTVIADTEYEAQIILVSGDTLNFSHKYIDKLITKETYKELYLNQRVIPRHKTKGWFVNAEILAHPFAISGGKRLDSNWNIGGTVFYGETLFNGSFGVAPYVRYYIGNNLFVPRFFLDAFVGVSKRDGSTFFTRDYNDYPVTGSVALGFQLPNTRDMRFYFKIGSFFTYDKVEFVQSSSQFPLQTGGGFNARFQASLIAIQF